MAVTGILGKKIGMTQVFDEKGDVHPITVLQAGPCVITQGPACSTVIGCTSPFSSKTCVIPIFFPKIPVTAMIPSPHHAMLNSSHCRKNSCQLSVHSSQFPIESGKPTHLLKTDN